MDRDCTDKVLGNARLCRPCMAKEGDNGRILVKSGHAKPSYLFIPVLRVECMHEDIVGGLSSRGLCEVRASTRLSEPVQQVSTPDGYRKSLQKLQSVANLLSAESSPRDSSRPE